MMMLFDDDGHDDGASAIVNDEDNDVGNRRCEYEGGGVRVCVWGGLTFLCPYSRRTQMRMSEIAKTMLTIATEMSNQSKEKFAIRAKTVTNHNNRK